MKRQNYYLASRAPSRGGLKIIKTDTDFPDGYVDFIEKSCLEIVTPEYSYNALLICPLKNGENVVSLARKVNGSEWEPRVHENIHGYVMDMEAFSRECVNAIAEDDFDDRFYDGKMEEAVTLADETFYYRSTCHTAGNLEQFWLSMSGREKIGFFHAVYRVITEREKIQLDIPASRRRIVQAACYDILPYACRDKLFTISGGECTQSDADILFVDKIQYQDGGKYRKMNLHTFIEEGIKQWEKGFIRMEQLLSRESFQRAHKDELTHKFEYVTAGNKKIQKLLCKEFGYLIPKTEKESPAEALEKRNQIAVCMDYVRESQPTKTKISTVRNDLYRNAKQEEWGNFQEELRLRLEEMSLFSRQRENYVSVLFLAYECYAGRCTDREQAVLPAPYDLEGMLLFLLQKTKSRCEYKKYVDEVLRQYTEVFLLYVPRWKVKKTVRKIKNCIVK